MYSTRAVIQNEIKNPDRMSGFFIVKIRINRDLIQKKSIIIENQLIFKSLKCQKIAKKHPQK